MKLFRKSLIRWGLIVFLTVPSCLLASDGFWAGYCSKYTRAGAWEFSWGDHDPRMYCVLLDHKLLPTGSPIAKTSTGYYDAFDMNRVEVKCRKKKHSFTLYGFGDYAMKKAYYKAKNYQATHCLFKVEFY